MVQWSLEFKTTGFKDNLSYKTAVKCLNALILFNLLIQDHDNIYFPLEVGTKSRVSNKEQLRLKLIDPTLTV